MRSQQLPQKAGVARLKASGIIARIGSRHSGHWQILTGEYDNE
jgi:hypothetical protein